MLFLLDFISNKSSQSLNLSKQQCRCIVHYDSTSVVLNKCVAFTDVASAFSWLKSGPPLLDHDGWEMVHFVRCFNLTFWTMTVTWTWSPLWLRSNDPQLFLATDVGWPVLSGVHTLWRRILSSLQHALIVVPTHIGAMNFSKTEEGLSIHKHVPRSFHENVCHMKIWFIM